jgi:hypothetical protein
MNQRLETSEPALKIDSKRALQPFLNHVAKGQQDEAKSMLQEAPETAFLLNTHGVFTDYSGRTFHCTGFEYAYWAKDIHMCHMLESFMTPKTKTFLFGLIDKIEEQDGGLIYHQHGIRYQTQHFDLRPLIKALNDYVGNHDQFVYLSKWDALNAAWMEIGKLQKDIPAHIAQEYCRKDRDFVKPHTFNEGILPRDLSYTEPHKWRQALWFEFGESTDTGLGRDFAILRGYDAHDGACGMVGAATPGWNPWLIGAQMRDLHMLKRLDESRNAQMTLLRQSVETTSRPSYCSCAIA